MSNSNETMEIVRPPNSTRSILKEDFFGGCLLNGFETFLRPVKSAQFKDFSNFLRRVSDDIASDFLHLPSINSVDSYLENLMKSAARGGEFPYLIYRKNSPKSPIGMTRFQVINYSAKRLQIGSTLVSSEWRGSLVNKDAKLAMIEYVFSRLDIERVEFVVDSDNEVSLYALNSLGATLEGKLRAYRCNSSGVSKDCYIFSITRGEWPELRAKLVSRLAKRLQ